MTKERKKLDHLEGFRGLMAFIVVIGHFILLFHPVTFAGSFDYNSFRLNQYSSDILIATTPLNLFMNGAWAVCLFFILSGYVLSLGYLKTNDTAALQTAVVKRYPRLALPVAAACLLIYLLHITGVFSRVLYPRHIYEYHFGKTLFLNNLPLIINLKIALVDTFLKTDTRILPVLWTLKLEFTGALLLFAFLFVTHNVAAKWRYYLLLTTVLLIAGFNHIILFFAGSFIANYEKKIAAFFSPLSARIPLLLFALYFGGIPAIEHKVKVLTMYAHTADWPDITNLYYQIISAILLFTWLISDPTAKKFFCSRPMLFLGKISFSLYLIHLPLLFITGSYILVRTHGQINFVLLFIVCAGICMVASYVFYYFIDRTAIRLADVTGKRFVNPRSKNRSPNDIPETGPTAPFA